MAEQPSEEYITVEYTRPVPYRWKSGRFVGRFCREMRDNKRLVANTCPVCNKVSMPPHMFCGKCKVKMNEELIEMSDTGTVQTHSTVVMRVWNPRTGDWYEDPYPGAFIRLDSGANFMHRLEETDMEKIHKGMRVKAVWKEEGRVGGPVDILYFRKIEE